MQAKGWMKSNSKSKAKKLVILRDFGLHVDMKNDCKELKICVHYINFTRFLTLHKL